ncbi:MAG: hypothetical protein M3Z24_00095, partial [Chloroflexota bacterium]|nr:hypothetical protein [Chloroflexota bacterium]
FLFIPLIMSCCTLLFMLALSFSWANILLSVLITFLSTCFIFGSQGWLIVAMNNRSARIRQSQQAPLSTTNE